MTGEGRWPFALRLPSRRQGAAPSQPPWSDVLFWRIVRRIIVI